MLSKLPFYGGTDQSWRRQISNFHIRWIGLANPTEQRSFCPSVGIGARARDGSSTASSIMTIACSVQPRKGWPAFSRDAPRDRQLDRRIYRQRAHRQGRRTPAGRDPTAALIRGVDIARQAEDQSVIRFRRGRRPLDPGGEVPHSTVARRRHAMSASVPSCLPEEAGLIVDRGNVEYGCDGSDAPA
jgi:hypothetical protein